MKCLFAADFNGQNEDFQPEDVFTFSMSDIETLFSIIL